MRPAASIAVVSPTTRRRDPRPAARGRSKRLDRKRAYSITHLGVHLLEHAGRRCSGSGRRQTRGTPPSGCHQNTAGTPARRAHAPARPPASTPGSRHPRDQVTSAGAVEPQDDLLQSGGAARGPLARPARALFSAGVVMWHHSRSNTSVGTLDWCSPMRPVAAPRASTWSVAPGALGRLDRRIGHIESRQSPEGIAYEAPPRLELGGIRQMLELTTAALVAGVVRARRLGAIRRRLEQPRRSVRARIVWRAAGR